MAALNFHRRKTRRWWYAGATLVAAALFSVFYVAGASSAPIGNLQGSPSGFESGDGNVALDGTAKASTDWACFVGSGGFQAGTPDTTNCKVTTGATQVWADGGTSSVGSNELEFAGGAKFDDTCENIISGNNPPKDEWTNIAEYTEADASNNVFFYGASVRPVTTGNSSGNVYFNQKANGCHTAGDVLIAFDFLNGGGTPTLNILRWVTTGSCYLTHDNAPCWGPATAVPAADYNGNTNGTGSINDTAISGSTLPANAFSEFGINLTQAIKDAGGTAPPCFAQQTWVSRSSGSSFGSQPEDVELVNRPTCGTITIIKHTQNGGGSRSGINQQFSYSTSVGLTPSPFHLNDATGSDVNCTNSSNVYADSTPTNPCNEIVYGNEPAGSYTVTETTPLPANFGFVSLACTSSPGSSATPDSSGSPTVMTATITLGISGNVVCTYTNKQQLGAIKITKTSSKGTALNGATFSITGPNSYSTSVTTSGTGASAGTACVSGLPFGTYSVTETAAPSGYSIDDPNAQSAVVSAFGDCSGNGTPVAISATDTPLTDLSVHVASEASGGTKSAIFCKNSSTNAAIGNSPQPSGAVQGTTSTYGDPVTLNADPTHGAALKPGTYTCTVVIDP